MIYLKIEGKYMTIKEIAEKYNMPLGLISYRVRKGVRDVNELIQPKHGMLRK